MNYLILTDNYTSTHTPGLWFQFSLNSSHLNIEQLRYQQGIFLLQVMS